MMPTLGQLAEHVDADVRGDATRVLPGAAPSPPAPAGAPPPPPPPRYSKHLAATTASAVILAEEHASASPTNALVTRDPYLAYARGATLLVPPPARARGYHPRAVVHPDSTVHEDAWVDANAVFEADVEIGAGVTIGPGCVIARGSRISEDSVLLANVFVGERTRIGRRAMIHPGVVIGSDGIGFANAGGAWIKVPQLGAVSIGDDVEIGANTTIDRGTLDDTVIEHGVNLDNQIQVAHNVVIGAHTAIAGCTGIAGSARIGARSTNGGGVGIVGHTEIVDDEHITGKSFVAHSIREPGQESSGTPLEPNREWRKNYARFHQLDDMARRLRRLEKAVKEHDDE